MKRLLKTLILCFIAICVSLSLFACGSDNSEEKGIICKKFKGDDFYTVYSYVDDGNGVTFLDIDAAVKQKYGSDAKIGKIKKNSFSGNDTLTEIIVPETVTEIAGGAFAKMKTLKKITVPFVGSTANADAYIRETAEAEGKSVDAARSFGYIFGTEEYAYGAAVTANYGSGTSTFYIPASLTEATISPKENYKIPAYAFCGITQINKVNLSEKITEIGVYAFSAAKSITEIKIPKNVSIIREGAFSENNALKKVEFANDCVLTEIGEKAFYKTGVANIILPNGATKLGDRCFAESSIAKITFSANLLSVGNYCFYNCSALNSVTFNGSALIKAHNNAFRKCSALTQDAAFKSHFDTTGSENVFD